MDKYLKNNRERMALSRAAMNRFGAFVFTVALVSGCAVNSGPAMAQPGTDYEVKILFDGSGCPKNTMFNGTLGAYPTLTNNKDRIFWQAYDMSGNTAQQNQYKIFFDPFKNSSIDSKNNGSTNTKKPEKKADIPTGANVFYKYTIWAKADCPDDPLDPRFNVI